MKIKVEIEINNVQKWHSVKWNDEDNVKEALDLLQRDLKDVMSENLGIFRHELKIKTEFEND